MAFPALPERLRMYFDQHTPGFWSWWQAAKFELDKLSTAISPGGSGVSHHALTDLTTYDDHTQYLNTSRAGIWHNTLAGAHVTNGNSHDHYGGDGAQIDHAHLANLTTGNPHTQYQLAASLNALTVVIKTSTYNLTSADHVVICNKASAMAINLYAATGSGRVHNLKNINTGVVTATPNGADTIDAAAYQTINQWENLTIIDYASGAWAIL